MSKLIKVGVMAAALVASGISCIPEPEITNGERTVPLFTREVYFLNDLSETVSVMNPATLEIYNDALTVGKWPNDIVHYDGRLYIVCSGDNTVEIYNRATFERIDTIYLGRNANPWSIIIAGNTGKAYVPNFIAGTVSVIDIAGRRVISTISVGAGPEGGAFVDGKVYICSSAWDSSLGGFGRGTVTVIDASTDRVLDVIDLEDSQYVPGFGSNPQSAIPFPDLHEVHIVCTGKNGGAGSDDGKIVIIDTEQESAALNRILGTLKIGGSPGWTRSGIDMERKIVYLTGVGGLESYYYGEGFGSADPPRILHGSADPIPIPGSRENFYAGSAVDEINGRLFLCDFTTDTIIVLDRQTYSFQKTLGGSDGTKMPIIVP